MLHYIPNTSYANSKFYLINSIALPSTSRNFYTSIQKTSRCTVTTGILL